jgi:hypothetical protein
MSGASEKGCDIAGQNDQIFAGKEIPTAWNWMAVIRNLHAKG